MSTSGCAVTSRHILKCWSPSQTPEQLSIERQTPSGAKISSNRVGSNPFLSLASLAGPPLRQHISRKQKTARLLPRDAEVMRKKIDDHNGPHAVAPWKGEGEGVGGKGGGLPVMSSYCRPPMLLIRKSAIYRLLRRRVRGKWTRVLRLCKHQSQYKAKKMYLCREKKMYLCREKFYIPDKTRQLSLEPLYVGTKSSVHRATQMPRPRIELGTFRSSV